MIIIIILATADVVVGATTALDDADDDYDENGIKQGKVVVGGGAWKIQDRMQ